MYAIMQVIWSFCQTFYSSPFNFVICAAVGCHSWPLLSVGYYGRYPLVWCLCWINYSTRYESKQNKKAELSQRRPRDVPYMYVWVPWLRPLLPFPKILMGFCSDRDYESCMNKKLSYRRETARQLYMTTWAGHLTFWWSHLAAPGTEHNSLNRITDAVLFCDIQTIWFKKCWPKTDFDMK